VSVARYRILPERSRIVAEARSSLRPIRADTTGLQGHFEAELTGGRLGATPPHGQVELAVQCLKTGNPLYDYQIERRLDARRYPRIRGEVREWHEIDAGRYRVKGALSFHGVTRVLEGEVRLRIVDERTVEFDGERVFDIRDFGLEPPHFLMLKVHPEVRVRGHVLAEREG
jgi:polyisoprenoid-binding protein YceI